MAYLENLHNYDLVEIVFNMCIKLKSGEHALSLYSC